MLRVLYGSITVHMETIDCSAGTRVFYGPLHCRDVLPREQEERLFGPLKAQQIQLTPRHPAPIAKDVFNTIKRGLIIEVHTHSPSHSHFSLSHTLAHKHSLILFLTHSLTNSLTLQLQIENGCIYATALCRAVIYYGSSPVRHSGTLAKEERTKVFNYTNRFLPALKQSSQSGAPITATPKPYVIFSFGQPWGGERSLSKNLVTMVVTYCRALNDFRVRNSVIHDELLFEAQESKDIRIISPTQADIDAETFLNPGTSEGRDSVSSPR